MIIGIYETQDGCCFHVRSFREPADNVVKSFSASSRVENADMLLKTCGQKMVLVKC